MWHLTSLRAAFFGEAYRQGFGGRSDAKLVDTTKSREGGKQERERERERERDRRLAFQKTMVKYLTMK